MKNKKESVLKGIIALLVSQIFIKFMGLAYKLYLTIKKDLEIEEMQFM